MIREGWLVEALPASSDDGGVKDVGVRLQREACDLQASRFPFWLARPTEKAGGSQAQYVPDSPPLGYALNTTTSSSRFNLSRT
jgi:hypothetical protein